MPVLICGLLFLKIPTINVSIAPTNIMKSILLVRWVSILFNFNDWLVLKGAKFCLLASFGTFGVIITANVWFYEVFLLLRRGNPT